MTELEMYMLLWQDDPYNHPAWPSFKEAMKDKEYGKDPLNQAWYFYRIGWEANKHE